MNFKKKTFLSVVSIATAISATTVPSAAEESDLNKSAEELFKLDPSTGTIVEYTGNSSDVTIPEEINGINVTAIGDSSFANKTIETVFIPEGVVKIGNAAFKGNATLKTVKFPSTLKEIGEQAFYGSKLTDLNLNEGLESIKKLAFSGNSISELDLPSTLKTIEDEAFMLNEITNITGGESLETIGFRSFYGNKLENLVIPNSVKVLGENSFENNTIQTLTLGNSVEDIKSNAFYGNKISTLNLNNSLKTIGDYAFQDNEISNEITFPDSLETVGYMSFSNNKLTKVSLGKNQTYVGQSAFEDNQITDLTLGEELLEIDDSAFQGNSVSKFHSNDKLQRIGIGAFEDNNTREITFGSNLIEIGSSAFGNYYNISDYGPTILELPSSLQKIGAFAFENNNNLQNISFGEDIKIKYLTQGSFKGANLNSIEIPKSVEWIEEDAFYDSGIDSLTFESDSSLYEIGERAFKKNNISTLDLSQLSKLRNISANAFEESGIKALTLNSGLNKLDREAFKNNQIEGSLFIPGSLYTLNSEVFFGNKIDSLTIGEGVGEILYDAFNENPIGDLNLPNSLRTIYAEAFLGSRLKELIVPEGVTFIGDSAFEGSSIEKLSLPNTLQTIGSRAFINNKISNLTVPNNLVYIGKNSFENNGISNALVFPETLDTIETSAFLGNSITGLTFNKKTMSKIGEKAFYQNEISGHIDLPLADNYNTKCQLNCEASLAFAGNNITSVSLPEGLLSVPSGLFSNNQIEEIVLPSTLTEILSEAFSDNKIDSISLPSGISIIGSKAFANNLIKEVDIPSKISTLSGDSFASNPLENVYIRNSSVSIPDSFLSGTTVLHGYLGSTAEAYANQKGLQFKVLGESPLKEEDIVFNNETQTIEGFKGDIPNGYAIIPDTVNGLPVLKIGENAFANMGIITLKLPESIKEIGAGAFKGNLLSNLSFEGDLESIGKEAFSNNKIKEVSFDSLTNLSSIGDSAFQGNLIEKLTLPNSVKNVGLSSFEGNKITTLTLSNSLEQIQDKAFYNNLIRSVNIPASVKSIGVSAFEKNELTSVILSEGLETIGERAFTGENSNNNISSDIVIPNSVKNIGKQAFKFNSTRKLVLGTGLTKIEDEAFTFSDYSPSTIEIPENITSIGSYTFSIGQNIASSRKTTSLKLHDKLTSIGAYSFSGQGLSTLDIPSLLSVIENGAFSRNMITSLSIPGNIIELKENSFYGNPLVNLEVSDNLEKIGPSAFYGTKLTSLDLKNVEEIGARAFYGNSLTDVTLNSSVESIGDYAFSHNNITNIVFERKMERINSSVNYGRGIFSNNALTEISIPEWIEEIPAAMFSDNEITNVIFEGQGLKKIEESAFTANLISELNLPSSLEYIGDYAFSDNKLTSLTLPENLDYIGGNAFTLNQISTLNVNDKLREIGTAAFKGNLLTELDLKNVSKVKHQAFYENKLNSVILPDSLYYIGSGAFAYNNLTTIIMPATEVVFASTSSLTLGAFAYNKIDLVIYPENFSSGSNDLLDEGEGGQNYQFYKNDVQNVIALSDNIHLGGDFEWQNHMDDSKVTIYGRTGTRTEMTANWYYYTFRNIEDFNLLEITNVQPDLKLLTLSANAEEKLKNNYDLIISGYSTSEKVDVYLENQVFKDVQVNNGQYELKVEYGEIFEDETLNVSVTDGEQTKTSSVTLNYEEPFVSVEVDGYRQYGNTFEVEIYVESNSPNATLTYEGITKNIELEPTGDGKYEYFETINKTITEDLLFEVLVEIEEGVQSKGDTLLTYKDAPDFSSSNVEVYQTRRENGFVDVTVQVTSPGEYTYTDWNVIPTYLPDMSLESFIPIPSLKEPETSLSGWAFDYGLGEPVFIENSETSHSLKKVNFIEYGSMYNRIPIYYEEQKEYIHQDEVNPLDESTFNGYTIYSNVSSVQNGTSTFTFPTKVTEDTTFWFYTYSEMSDGTPVIAEIHRLDVKYIPEGTKLGSVEVEYIDENGQKISSKVVEDLVVGETYEEEAILIEGYELVGESKKSAVVSEDESDKITFTYKKKLEETAPENPVLKGVAQVQYLDENGNLINTKIVNDISMGSHTEIAPEIEGYNIVGENEKTVYFDSENLTQIIVFNYERKEDPKPEITEGTVTVKYVDTSGKELLETLTKNVPFGTHEENHVEIEGYNLREKINNVYQIDNVNLTQTVTFVYEKIEAPVDTPEIEYGNVKVNYIDEKGAVISSKELLNVPFGQHIEYALEIEGYKLKGEEQKIVTIDKDNLEHEINFVYSKEEQIVITSGTLNVEYVDINGLNIAPSVSKILPMGEHIETAISISGYNNSGETSVSINVTEENLIHNIKFIYEKVEVDPIPEVKPDPDPIPEVKPDPDPIPEIKPDPDPIPEIKPDPDPIPEVKPDPDPIPEVKPDPDPIPEVKPDPDPIPEIKPDPDPIPEVKPDPDPIPEVKPDPDPIPEVKPDPDPIPEAKPETEADKVINKTGEEFNPKPPKTGDNSIPENGAKGVLALALAALVLHFRKNRKDK